MTCGLAEAAVTETEQDAVAVPAATSAQLAGLKVSVGMVEEKLTVPVGVVVTPADVLTTVAVTVIACPTLAVELERETDVEVVRLETVRVDEAELPWWTLLPA